MTTLRVPIAFDPAAFNRALVADKAALRRGVMIGAERTTATTKDLLRGEVRRAGLGDRLANAVRVDMRPTRAQSLRPAILVFGNSALLDYFHDGNTIQGTPWLAIPTPEAEKRGYASHDMSRKGNAVPGNQQRRVARLDLANRDFDVRTRYGRNGGLILIGLPKPAGKPKRGRPRKGVPPAAPQSARGLHLFTLVRRSRVPLLLAFPAHHQRIAQAFAANINRAAGAEVARV